MPSCLPQVLLGRGSSPSTRLMPTPTTCPKLTPGEKRSPARPTTSHRGFKRCLPLSPSFNRIDIPPYEHYDKLYDKLLTAIEETCGFAVE